jgi:hypothetical protein
MWAVRQVNPDRITKNSPCQTTLPPLPSLPYFVRHATPSISEPDRPRGLTGITTNRCGFDVSRHCKPMRPDGITRFFGRHGSLHPWKKARAGLRRSGRGFPSQTKERGPCLWVNKAKRAPRWHEGGFKRGPQRHSIV